MNVNEIREKSRSVIGPYCKSCPVCNGKACSNKIPGPGSKGTGTVAIKNYEAWQKIEVKMDTLAENKEIDTTFEMFGKTFKYPIFAGPVGAVSQHYSDLYNDNSFNEIYVRACAKSGIAAFTGDGLNEEIMVHATHYIKENNGIGVPTIKPWDKSMFRVIEKAIIDSDLGIMPENNGEIIRIGIPPLTEERRKQLAKQCKAEGETAKVSIRNARRDGIDALKKAVKDGLAEDEQKNAEAKLQKVHDKYIAKIEEMLAEKDKEIMTV